MKILKNNGTFKILTKTENIIGDIATAARTCYQSQDKASPENDLKLVKALITRGHEAMLEFADMTVKFQNVSRYFSHEQVRHRVASYAQESTRYVQYDNENIKSDPRCKFNLEDESDIVSMYVDGNSANDISKIVGCSNSTIVKILDRNNIEIREPGDFKCKSFNPFKKENISKIYAQILGFIYADGNVYHSKSSGSPYTISIKIKDYEYIKQLEYFLGGSLFYYKEEDIWKLQINSKSWYDTLINEYGCVENKSLVIDSELIKKNLPKELFPHFIRGFFEGDGSIGFYKTKRALTFYSGSMPFLEWVKQVIYSETGILSNKILKSKDSNCFSLRFQSESDIRSVLKWMYSDFSFELILIRKLIIANRYEKFDTSNTISIDCNNLNVINPNFCDLSDVYNYILMTQQQISMYNSLKGELSNNDRRIYLPSNLKTEIVVKTNIREWRKIFSLRCDRFAHWEIRKVMLDLLRYCKTNIPIIFDDFYFFTTEDGQEYAKQVMTDFQLKEALTHYSKAHNLTNYTFNLENK